MGKHIGGQEMGEQRTYRGVRNADILVLSKVRYYMAQIESLEERTSWQRLRLKRMTQQFSAAPGGRDTAARCRFESAAAAGTSPSRAGAG